MNELVLQKKVCLVGAFSVGKTSLIQRYVHSLFSEKYQTTVGVKIDKKIVVVDDTKLNLMLWDVAGEDDFTQIRPAHLRGLAGYIVVIDGTRPNSFDVALDIHLRIQRDYGIFSTVFVLNKSDLQDQWRLTPEHLHRLINLGFPVVQASALSGEGVENIFTNLARQLVTAHTGA